MTTHPDLATSTPATWADMSTAQRVAAASTLTLICSAAKAAVILGTTKNSLGAFCRRQKIPLGQWKADAPFVRRPPPFKVEPAVPSEVWKPLREPVALLERKSRECAWPVGPDSARQCCGARKVRGSYCATHAALAYAPRRGDPAYSQRLMGTGRAVDPGITIEEAVAVVGVVREREVEE